MIINSFKNNLSFVLLLCAFLFQSVGAPSAFASERITLPALGPAVSQSPSYNPILLKGIKLNAAKPLAFEFIVDPGDANAKVKSDLNLETARLIKYFLAALTVPDQDVWVNLSPYEKNRIVPESFGLTEMGRDLLAEDYLLKQITSSLMHPDGAIGKKFWARVYEQAAQKGISHVPVRTFNKVWIVPEQADVYENAKVGAAYVVDAKLKVMLEEDYLAKQKNQRQTGDRSAKAGGSDVFALPAASGEDADRKAPPRGDGWGEDKVNTLLTGPASSATQIIRDIIIPELTKEVNTGASFAQLRQVYHSLILATWYKKKIKASILSKVYVDQKKIKGLEPIGSVNQGQPGDRFAKAGGSEVFDLPAAPGEDADRTAPPRGDGWGEDKVNTSLTGPASLNNVEQIYRRYLQAFKKGAYNLIKEERDLVSGQIIPRKYFSGGMNFDGAMLGDKLMRISAIPPRFNVEEDNSMVAEIRFVAFDQTDDERYAKQIVKDFIGNLKRLIRTSGHKDDMAEEYAHDMLHHINRYAGDKNNLLSLVVSQLRMQWDEKGGENEWGLSNYIGNQTIELVSMFLTEAIFVDDGIELKRFTHQLVDQGSIEERMRSYWLAVVSGNIHLRRLGYHQGLVDLELLTGVSRLRQFHDVFVKSDVKSDLEKYLEVMLEGEDHFAKQVGLRDKNMKVVPALWGDLMLWGLILALDPSLYVSDEDQINFDQSVQYMTQILAKPIFKDNRSKIESWLIQALSRTPEDWKKLGLVSPFDIIFKEDALSQALESENGFKRRHEVLTKYPQWQDLFHFALDDDLIEPKLWHRTKVSDNPSLGYRFFSQLNGKPLWKFMIQVFTSDRIAELMPKLARALKDAAMTNTPRQQRVFKQIEMNATTLENLIGRRIRYTYEEYGRGEAKNKTVIGVLKKVDVWGERIDEVHLEINGREENIPFKKSIKIEIEINDAEFDIPIELKQSNDPPGAAKEIIRVLKRYNDPKMIYDQGYLRSLTNAAQINAAGVVQHPELEDWQKQVGLFNELTDPVHIIIADGIGSENVYQFNSKFGIPVEAYALDQDYKVNAEVLRRDLQDKNTLVRIRAARLAGYAMAFPKVLDISFLVHLKPLLDDEDPIVRKVTARSIERLLNELEKWISPTEYSWLNSKVYRVIDEDEQTQTELNPPKDVISRSFAERVTQRAFDGARNLLGSVFDWRIQAASMEKTAADEQAVEQMAQLIKRQQIDIINKARDVLISEIPPQQEDREKGVSREGETILALKLIASSDHADVPKLIAIGLGNPNQSVRKAAVNAFVQWAKRQELADILDGADVLKRGLMEVASLTYVVFLRAFIELLSDKINQLKGSTVDIQKDAARRVREIYFIYGSIKSDAAFDDLKGNTFISAKPSKDGLEIQLKSLQALVLLINSGVIDSVTFDQVISRNFIESLESIGAVKISKQSTYYAEEVEVQSVAKQLLEAIDAHRKKSAYKDGASPKGLRLAQNDDVFIDDQKFLQGTILDEGFRQKELSRTEKTIAVALDGVVGDFDATQDRYIIKEDVIEQLKQLKEKGYRLVLWADTPKASVKENFVDDFPQLQEMFDLIITKENFKGLNVKRLEEAYVSLGASATHWEGKPNEGIQEAQLLASVRGHSEDITLLGYVGYIGKYFRSLEYFHPKKDSGVYVGIDKEPIATLAQRVDDLIKALPSDKAQVGQWKRKKSRFTEDKHLYNIAKEMRQRRLNGERMSYGFWKDDNMALHSILVAVDTIEGFKKARDDFKKDRKIVNLNTMLDLYREHVLEFRSKDGKKKGQQAFFNEVGALSGLFNNPEPSVIGQRLNYWIRRALPELAAAFAQERTVRGDWDDPQYALKQIRKAFGKVPGFLKAWDENKIGVAAQAYREHVMRYVSRTPKQRRTKISKQVKTIIPKGAQAFMYEVGGLRVLMVRSRAFLSKTGSPEAILNFAFPGLINLDDRDALKPWEVDKKYWFDENNVKNHFISVLDRIPHFMVARSKGNKRLMRRAYDFYINGYKNINTGRRGPLVFFLEKSELDSIMKSKRDYKERFKDPLAILKLAVPELVNAQDPENLKLISVGPDKSQFSQNKSDVGGIDLTAQAVANVFTVHGDGTISLPIDPQLVDKYKNASGFTPIVVSFRPIGDVRAFLGISN